MATYSIQTREAVSWVEVQLANETVRAESGALRYMRGPIQMESKAPGIGGIFKAAMSGENVFRPTYTGTGLLVLEPALGGFYELELTGETLVLDQGAYWCSDGGIQVSATANKAMTALVGGEGWFQTTVAGNGKVIICIPGPVQVLDLANERLVVDGPLAVARSSSLNYKVERSTKSLFGSMTSGEGVVNVFEGSGRVWLCPIPFPHVMLRASLAASIGSVSAR